MLIPMPLHLNILQFIEVLSGLMSGLWIAGLFSPIDRALYLSTTHHRSFLVLENFTAPFHGLNQALFQRIISGGTYFLLQSNMQRLLYPVFYGQLGFSHSMTQSFIGMAAGLLNGLLLSPLAAVKYQTWGNERATFLQSAKHMYLQGGYKPFIKGMRATMTRDIIFGAVYEYVRSSLCAQCLLNIGGQSLGIKKLAIDLIAAIGATIFSAPFNYVRNRKFSTPPDQKPLNTLQTWKDLWRRSGRKGTNFIQRLPHFQRALGLGWGSARVALAMAFGQTIYDVSKNILSNVVKSRF